MSEENNKVDMSEENDKSKDFNDVFDVKRVRPAGDPKALFSTTLEPDERRRKYLSEDITSLIIRIVKAGYTFVPSDTGDSELVNLEDQSDVQQVKIRIKEFVVRWLMENDPNPPERAYSDIVESLLGLEHSPWSRLEDPTLHMFSITGSDKETLAKDILGRVARLLHLVEGSFYIEGSKSQVPSHLKMLSFHRQLQERYTLTYYREQLGSGIQKVNPYTTYSTGTNKREDPIKIEIEEEEVSSWGSNLGHASYLCTQQLEARGLWEE